MMLISAQRKGSAHERGAASLAVVMVLFFIISMVAAYTSRNLIFEQRTSINQYRSTQALEAADAGLEWTLAMLNQGVIDSDCNVPTGTPGLGATSFRQRYIDINATSKAYTPKDVTARPTCVFNGSSWTCKCPATGNGAPTAPTGAGIWPAFRVRFEPIDWAGMGLTDQAALIRVRVAACTRLDDDCLDPASTGASSEGRAVVTALVSIAGNMAAPPIAALLARGSVNLTGSPTTVANSDSGSAGVTVQAGSIVTPGTNLIGPPGTPGIRTLVEDPALNAPGMTADRMFASVFNVSPVTFEAQPAAVLLDCSGPSCTDTQVSNAMAKYPGQPIVVNGGLAVGGDIGTAASPALLVVKGNLTFSGGTPTVYGAVYVRTASWTASGTGSVQGAVIAEGSVAGTSPLTIVRDAEVLKQLQFGVGSIVRVPATWRDFQ